MTSPDLNDRWAEALSAAGAQAPRDLPDLLARIERFGALAVRLEAEADAIARDPNAGVEAMRSARAYADRASLLAAGLLDREADLRRRRARDLAAHRAEELVPS